MSTRKTRIKKDEIAQGASSRQSKDRNTNAHVAAIAGAKRTKNKATSETSQKRTRKQATTASKEATVKGSRSTSGKKLKGTDSKEYKQKSAKHKRSAWEDPKEQIHTNNPGRIYNEQNTRGLGVRKREQNSRNISGENIYEHGASVYGDGDRYRTDQGASQYPPFDREGYNEQQPSFRNDLDHDDSYWWEGQFPQGASSWEGDGRWQHHDRSWEHRQNSQGHRSERPYGGDYEKQQWMQRQRAGYRPHSEDFERGYSRGRMTTGEAIYPEDQRMREDIYQDPGMNFDRSGSGYMQAYAGGDDVGHVPDNGDWNENMGGSHYHRDDLDWDQYGKRRDMNDYELNMHSGRRNRNGNGHQTGGSWGPRDEYRQNNEGSYGRSYDEGRRDNGYHSRSTNMRDRIMDHLEEGDEDGRMRTVWTNSLDEPYQGGYNTRTAQSDRRVVGQGGYNQGGYGRQKYSYEYGNAGGYGSTGSYQSGHRGEHRRGGYQEGSRYAARQDRFKERDMNNGNYDRSYIAGSDDSEYDMLDNHYKAKMNQDLYMDESMQREGNVHGMQKYGEGEGSKWKNLGKSHTKRSQR